MDTHLFRGLDVLRSSGGLKGSCVAQIRWQKSSNKGLCRPPLSLTII